MRTRRKARAYLRVTGIALLCGATDMRETKCRVCGLEQGEAIWGDDGLSPTYAICACCGCEFGIEDSLPSAVIAYREKWVARRSLDAVDIFHRRAHDYAAKYMDVGDYRASLDRFCDAVGKDDAHILEVGCGPGNITRYLLQRHSRYRVLGIDLAAAMLNLARANNPTAEFRSMDARDIHSLKTKFDGIVCGFCTPYLSREEAVQLIADSAALLVPGGALYLSTMEGDYASSAPQLSSDGNDAAFIYMHQADYLIAALATNGFAVVDLSRNTTDLVIVATRN